MSICKRVARTFKGFTGSQAGNVGILFALSVIPMFLAAGAAVDMVRLNVAQTQVQAALDAAALAAAAAPTGTPNAKRVKIGEATFNANMAGGANGNEHIDVNFKFQNGAVAARASGEMATSLMRIGGIDTLQIAAEAEVNMLNTKDAEVVLVLDYSGSMGDSVSGGQKYKLMNTAAIKLVNDLKAAGSDKVKIGLVPFSQYVRATLPANHVLGATGSTWTGCTQDRGAPYNLTDSEPDGTPASKWGQPLNPEHASYTCASFAANNLNVRPLTNDFSAVTSQIASMKPGGYTHIALGLEFGFQLISNNAPFTEAVDFDDKETTKFVVLLTDGSQTEKAKGPGGVRSVAQGNTNTEALCSNIKGKGVKLITMAFDLTDQDPSLATAMKNRLRNCATDPSTDYFDANIGADLNKAFESIRVQVSQNIFLNK